MIFAGLPLAELVAIFAAVGVGVAVLYVLKLRRRVVAVPFSPLWERILRDKEATTLFSKLKRLLSLLLQLALLALLVLALGDPRAGRASSRDEPSSCWSTRARRCRRPTSRPPASGSPRTR